MSALERIRVVCLLVAIAGASAATTAVICRPRSPGPPATSRSVAAWDGWEALSEPQRLARIQRYRTITRRPDAKQVFQRVRAFARLLPSEQQRLRLLHAALEEALTSLPASRRTVLLDLHEHARAEAIYDILERTSPETVAELRRRLRGQP